MKFAALLFLAACATESSQDVTGPFTGTTHRYVVDAIALPVTNTQAREFGDDLNGDMAVDNQLGQVIATLASFNDVTSHGPEMIAAGAIASSFEIVANDLQDDPSVSVLYRGADGEEAVEVGGEMIDGRFRSNRTATTSVPGKVRAHLPVFVDADPAVIDIEGLEIDLEPDGHGGFNGFVRGVVDSNAALHAAYPGAAQMLAAGPNAHMEFMRLLDMSPRDWKLSETEFVTNDFLTSLFASDIMYRGEKRLSFGYRVHLSACADGRCATSAPSCDDRVRDGDETDVDCGGSCGKCPANGQCSQASDCQSNACNGSVCAAPSCTDGVRDGFETDVDCGSECGPCSVGQQCYTDGDCGTGHTCGAPCKDGDWLCGGYDHCI